MIRMVKLESKCAFNVLVLIKWQCEQLDICIGIILNMKPLYHIEYRTRMVAVAVRRRDTEIKKQGKRNTSKWNEYIAFTLSCP